MNVVLLARAIRVYATYVIPRTRVHYDGRANAQISCMVRVKLIATSGAICIEISRMLFTCVYMQQLTSTCVRV